MRQCCIILHFITAHDGKLRLTVYFHGYWNSIKILTQILVKLRFQYCQIKNDTPTAFWSKHVDTASSFSSNEGKRGRVRVLGLAAVLRVTASNCRTFDFVYTTPRLIIKQYNEIRELIQMVKIIIIYL